MTKPRASSIAIGFLLRALVDGPRSTRMLCKATGMQKSTVTAHLVAWRRRKLVRIERWAPDRPGGRRVAQYRWDPDKDDAVFVPIPKAAVQAEWYRRNRERAMEAQRARRKRKASVGLDRSGVQPLPDAVE